jgi:hypothetical protein
MLLYHHVYLSIEKFLPSSRAMVSAITPLLPSFECPNGICSMGRDGRLLT